MRARLTLPLIPNELYISSTFLPIEALARRPVEECLVLPERQTLAVQRGEHLRGQPRFFTEGLERVVDLRERSPALLEHHGDATKLDVGGTVLSQP
jgi:hypothetical protein